MKILDRHVLREVAIPSLLAFAVVSFVAVANELRERMEDLPVAFLNIVDLGRLVFFFLPALASYVLAITYMMGVLFAFGRLTQDGEIIAMRAAGVPLKRLVRPVILGGLAISALCFIIQDRVQPWAVGRMEDLMYRELPARRSLDVLPAGVLHHFGDWRLYIGSIDPEDGAWRNVDILDGEGLAFFAKRARVVPESGDLELRDVLLITPQNDRPGTRLVSSPQLLLTPPETAPESLMKRSRMGLSLAGLFDLERGLTHEAETGADAKKAKLRSVREDIATRFSLPLAALAVTLVSAPLAVRGRRSGRSYSFAIGFTIILVYYVIFMQVPPQSLSPLAEVVARAQAPNLLLGAAGLCFLWRVDRV